MNCRDFERLSALDPGRELSADMSARLETHLASCSVCRDFAERMSATRGIIESWREANPPEELMAEVRRNVLSRIQEERLAPPFRQGWSPLFRVPGARIIGSAAAAAMILAVGWIVREQLRSGSPPAPREPITIARGAAPALPFEQPMRQLVKVPEQAAIRREAGGVGSARPVASKPAEPARAAAVRTAAGHAGQEAPILRRIELQTADPNIRIIWLFPEKTKSPEPEGPRGG